MGLRINANIAAINAHRYLVSNDNGLAKSLEKLSSGFRINKAADDAAGLAISEKLRSQVRGLNQALRNAQDGVSMLQTAEGSLNEVHSMLQRIRELSVQASNDTLSTQDRAAVNTEIQQLATEIDSIKDRVTFNGKYLLNGSLVTSLGGATGTDLVVNDTISNLGESAVATKIEVASARAGETFTLSSAAAGTITLTRGSDSVAQTVNVAAIAANGEQVLDFSALGVKVTLVSSAGITAANIVAGLTAAADDTIVTAAGSGSANLQIGPNAADSLSVALTEVSISSLGLTTPLADFNGSQSVANAQALITAVDTAVVTTSTRRATLGAAQNRLEYTIASLGVASENLEAAESRVRDADMAKEMVGFTRNQILLQAGTAMLAQANAAPQSVLQLLR